MTEPEKANTAVMDGPLFSVDSNLGARKPNLDLEC